MLGTPKGWNTRGLGFCGSVILLTVMSPAVADDASNGARLPLTLEHATHEAVNWHPSVTEAIGRLNARTEDVDVAKAGYRPQISVGLESGYNNTMQSNWRPRPNVSASQMLYDFGKVSSSVAFARAGTKMGQAQLLLAVDSLIRDTSYAMIEVQRGDALRQVALDQLETISSISDMVRYRYERGAATKSDALQAQARVEAASSTIAEITAQQLRWASNLAYLLGREEIPVVSPDVPEWFFGSCSEGEPDWPTVPAVMYAEAQRNQAVAELDRSKADRMPTVSVGANGAADVRDPFSGRSQYSIGINVSSDLYNGGAHGARSRGAAYALGAADAAAANAQNEASRQLAEAQRQIASYTDVLNTLISRQDSMSETGRLYRLQYLEMGTRTLVDLLNAEQELHQVRFSAVNTRHDLRRLQADCLFSAGSARRAFALSGTVVQGVRL